MSEDLEIEMARRVWSESVISETSIDPNTQWLLGGRNLRVDLLKALEAIYLSARLYLRGKLVVASGTVTPSEVISLVKSLFDVAATTLDALREKLRQATYAACVVLAGHPEGMTASGLETELREFLENEGHAKLPFYMGFTESFIEEARKQTSAQDWFSVILDDLRDGNWVTETDGLLRFRERHFVWGLSEVF